MKECMLGRMSWPEVKEAVNAADAILIPVGAIEQHAHHLNIEFDAATAEEICKRTAAALLQKGRYAVVAPNVNYGISWYHKGFPGTVSISHRTFMDYIKDICRSFSSHGFKNIIIVNGHGGNSSALMTCLDELYAESHIRVLLAQWFAMVGPVVKRLQMHSPRMHAGEMETSLGMALGMKIRHEQLCKADANRMEKLKEAGQPVSRHIMYDPTSPGSNVLMPMNFMEDITATGVIGDAGLATQEKGDAILARSIEVMTELVFDLAGA